MRDLQEGVIINLVSDLREIRDGGTRTVDPRVVEGLIRFEQLRQDALEASAEEEDLAMSWAEQVRERARLAVELTEAREQLAEERRRDPGGSLRHCCIWRQCASGRGYPSSSKKCCAHM